MLQETRKIAQEVKDCFLCVTKCIHIIVLDDVEPRRMR